MVAKKVKAKDRKRNTIVMLSDNEIKFLDRKISKKSTNLVSRSAIIRYLVNYAAEKPGILDKA